MLFLLCMFFFFKQKTAYVVRISDWSSDVCSSALARLDAVVLNPRWNVPTSIAAREILPRLLENRRYLAEHDIVIMERRERDPFGLAVDWRSEERRVGKACVSTCRARGSGDHKKTNSINNKIETEFIHKHKK